MILLDNVLQPAGVICAERLLVADQADLSNHLALMELSRDPEGQTRLLTTNFDTMFERAWRARHQHSIASHAGAAMPQPKVAGFTGILHLHGRLGDAETDPPLGETNLVLTSAEFGDAYLRSGWASRYVYDLVRACTVVVVGYEADDPPMRYLLEVLEADRERYPDLQKVYAFGSCAAGEEEFKRELWLAKGVGPILYAAQNGNHSPLYDSVREWRRYADDPTAWRGEKLRKILSKKPNELTEAEMRECLELLAHGDASQLLGELSPAADWLPELLEKGVFSGSGVRPGEWIASRTNDPDMIRACSALPSIDEQSGWSIERAVALNAEIMTPVRVNAWQIILTDKRKPREPAFDNLWHEL